MGEYLQIHNRNDVRAVLPEFLSEDDICTAVCTDRYCVETLSELLQTGNLIDRLLELRVFNEMGELLVCRDYLGEPFWTRVIEDGEDNPYAFFEETHYLDLDGEPEIKNSRAYCRTMGGGSYVLPFSEKKDRVKVRTYLAEAENGTEYAVDWRIVAFLSVNDETGKESGTDADQ